MAPPEQMTAAADDECTPRIPGISWDVTNPFTARVLQQSASQIQHIAETTRAQVLEAIDEAYQQGLSIPNAAALIKERMLESTPARARLIARTELSGIVNGGSLTAAQIVTGATGEPLYKKWLVGAGAKHPRHELYSGLNGQVRALDDYFDVGGSKLQHPGDPAGPPRESCNCRCTVSYTDEMPGTEGPIDPELLGFESPSL